MVRRPFTEREGGEREREGVRERERKRRGRCIFFLVIVTIL